MEFLRCMFYNTYESMYVEKICSLKVGFTRYVTGSKKNHCEGKKRLLEIILETTNS